MESNPHIDEHVRAVSVDRTAPAAPIFSVALLGHDGEQPPRLTPLDPRVAGDVSAVHPTDDVVVCYGDNPAADVRELSRVLGRAMPAVLVAARRFDAMDVAACFDHGATSYLVLTQTPELRLAEAAIRTARGESCLSPVAATALLRHVHRATFTAPEWPTVASSLTTRERQVMELLVIGRTIAEIADHLMVTRKTVRNYLSRIYAKLQVHRQSEVILLWLQKPLPIPALPPGRRRGKVATTD